MFARVEVMVPKLADGALLELPHDVFGVPNCTWFGTLNISIRNCNARPSEIRKSLKVEKSMFTCFGPLRL
ncbi:MAG: hypothetical protein JWP63_3804, partial [Candidatus Solibacter sp.]|nr:hypothetical protein [Candidatus Solibacter sp.]